MKPQVLLRKIHRWGSIAIATPIVVMIGAGVLLTLKKDVDWIQPPTQEGSSLEVPSATFEEMLAAAKSVPEAGITTWQDLARVDIKPDKGIVKFISKSRWEVQIDTSTAEILQVAYRRSDLIETIHDGTFFAEPAKLFLILPAGVILFVLWCTGIYMFFLPHYKRRQRRRKKGD
jgi:uncharacterized iron-regulated membrane protein